MNEPLWHDNWLVDIVLRVGFYRRARVGGYQPGDASNAGGGCGLDHHYAANSYPLSRIVVSQMERKLLLPGTLWVLPGFSKGGATYVPIVPIIYTRRLCYSD